MKRSKEGKAGWYVFFAVIIVLALLSYFFFAGEEAPEEVVLEENSTIAAFVFESEELFVGTVDITDIKFCEASFEDCNVSFGDVLLSESSFYVQFTADEVSSYGGPSSVLMGSIELYKDGDYLKNLLQDFRVESLEKTSVIYSSKPYNNLEPGAYVMKIIAGDDPLLGRTTEEVSFEVKE